MTTNYAPVPEESPETDEQIIARYTAKITRRFGNLSAMQTRMDRHYGLWRMEKFTPSPQEGIDPEDAITSNLDRVVADKVVQGIASSKRIVRVENSAAKAPGETANDNAEYLAIGFLNLSDRRLEDRAEPTLQDQLGSFAAIRGRYVIARALLIKDLLGNTVVDITPFDPRNFVFDKGRNGITWACYQTMKPRSEIRDSYPGFQFSESESVAGSTANDIDDGWQLEKVYDYYERRPATMGQPSVDEMGQPVPPQVIPESTWNGVIIASKWAKRLTNTFAVKWPIIVRPVGSMPDIQVMAGAESNDDTSADFGPSIFTLNEKITPKLNRAMSYELAITAQQVDRAYKAKSIGGNLSFDKNPTKKGAEIVLDTQAGEDVEVLPPPTTSHDAQANQQNLMNMWHAGALAAQALSGQPPPGGLSAAAMRLLGNNIGERTRPFLKPVESCIQGCIEALVAQYETGSYMPVHVTGKTSTGTPFDQDIQPTDIQGHGQVTIRLVQDLPEDDQIKVATAIQATTPNSNGVSLLSMEYAREHMLDVQDTDLEDMRQSLEKAKQEAPVLHLTDMYKAALGRGDTDMAQYVANKIEVTKMREALEELLIRFKYKQAASGPNGLAAALGGVGGQQGQPGAAQKSQNGIDSRVSSVENSQPGTVGASPSPTAGQNSTSPRPGGQNEQALNQIGLTAAGA